MVHRIRLKCLANGSKLKLEKMRWDGKGWLAATLLGKRTKSKWQEVRSMLKKSPLSWEVFRTDRTYGAAMKVEVLVTQSYQTLCDLMGCSPRGSSICRILQARILEWVATAFSSGSSQSRDRTWVSCTAGRFFTV